MGTGSTVRARQPLALPDLALPGELRAPAASGLLERQAGLLGEAGADLTRLGALANAKAAAEAEDAGKLEGERAAIEGRAPARDARPAWLLPSAEAFNKAAATGYAAGLEASLRGERDRLAAEANGDPAAFERGWGKVRDRVTAGLPAGMLERAELGLAKFGLEGRAAVETLGRRRTLEASEAATLTALDGRRADLGRAARAGDLEAAGRELAAHEASLAEALGAGLLSGERAAALRRDARHAAVVQGWLGKFERAGFSTAGLAAFQKAATPDLEPGERDELLAHYRAELSRRETGRWQGVADAWDSRIGAAPREALAALEAAGMVQRRELAAEAERWAGRPAAVMSKPEIETLAGTLERATSADAAVLLGNLRAALPADQLRRLMGEVAPKAPLMAVAASLDDRWLREEVLAGREALDANPALAPAASLDDWRATVSDTLGEAFSEMPLALGHVELAARVLYARRALAEHDLSGVIDTTRLKRALRDVTGGVLDTSWGTVLPPRRGVDAAGFGRMMAGLEDGDLGPAAPVTASGAPITAADIREHGQLVTVGPGRYLVRFGETWAATADGRRYVLDLSSADRPRALVPRPPAASASAGASGGDGPAFEPAARPRGLPAWVPWGPGGG